MSTLVRQAGALAVAGPSRSLSATLWPRIAFALVGGTLNGGETMNVCWSSRLRSRFIVLLAVAAAHHLGSRG